MYRGEADCQGSPHRAGHSDPVCLSGHITDSPPLRAG